MRLNREKIKKLHIFRRLSGIFLILLGILGLALPILPGWLLIFLGLSVWGINIYFLEQIKEYIRKKVRNRKLKKLKKV